MRKKVFLHHAAALALLFATTSQFAHAGFISTDRAVAVEQRQLLLSDVQAKLAGDQVKQALLHLGVAEDHVAARIAAMTDSELLQVSQQLDELPAGAGAIEIIGVVFLVLLILELVGVTDVFTAI